jgi:hypothetical protein
MLVWFESQLAEIDTQFISDVFLLFSLFSFFILFIYFPSPGLYEDKNRDKIYFSRGLKIEKKKEKKGYKEKRRKTPEMKEFACVVSNFKRHVN